MSLIQGNDLHLVIGPVAQTQTEALIRIIYQSHSVTITTFPTIPFYILGFSPPKNRFKTSSFVVIAFQIRKICFVSLLFVCRQYIDRRFLAHLCIQFFLVQFIILED
ncbi:hypothetical protein BC941DRAFT_408514 [Chlamydoabsidia padenii]|nr:hypothetical protein BC941DRAFT_408514 [Chlamydoabsidia padenii]